MPRSWRWTARRDSRVALNMTKILLVEDNEMNRDMLGRRLQRHGFAVCFAVDAQAASAWPPTRCPTSS